MKRLLSAASLALALAWSGAAGAVPVIGDDSSVTLVVDASSLGVTVTPLGSTTLDVLGRYVLPITGGDVELSPLTGTVQHDGSGLSFVRGASSLTIENLSIDFGTNVVTGDVGGTVGTGNFELFMLQPCRDLVCSDGHGRIPVSETGVFLSANGSALVNMLFEGPVVSTGDQIALADIRLRLEDGNSVPEPGSLLLLGGGLAGLALVRRSKSAIA